MAPTSDTVSKMVAARPKRTRRRAKGVYNSYIAAVLAKVAPGVSITGEALHAMHDVAEYVVHRIASRAQRVQRRSGRLTMTAREIECGFEMECPVSVQSDVGQQLVSHGKNCGATAVTKYQASRAA